MPGRRTLAVLAALAATAAPAHAAAPACPFLPHATQTPGEGLPDPARALDSTARPLRIAMLFVAPPGAAPAEPPAALFDALGPPAERWFAAASYGRARIELTPVPRWLTVETLDLPHALAAADVSGYDAAVAVVPGELGLATSYSAVLPAGAPRFGVLLARPSWQILVHELAHLLGLPDLYGSAGAGAVGVFAGPWDPMSEPLGQNVLAWHAWQLGWLDAGALRCVAAGAAEQRLTPAGDAGGVKALVLPLGPGSAIVVEARRPAGLDAALAGGVLVYDVETDAVPGAPPVRVIGGPLRPGGSLVDAGIRVDVGDGYRVRVRR